MVKRKKTKRSRKDKPKRRLSPLRKLTEPDVAQEQEEEGMAGDLLIPGDALEGFGVVDIAAGEKTARPLDEETAMEVLTAGANTEAVMDDIGDYATMGAVEEDFAERQLNTGARPLRRKLREHHAKTPGLSADDVDAAWDEADVGEEAVGGSTPTPDQDVVDELGEAAGLTYEDDEPLNTLEKLQKRNRHRWELDPDSVQETE